PGTLWCGAGSNADAYEQLGEHRDTDRCCRDHDHCQHVIHPFTARYGYRNLTLPLGRLKECLRRVNDTASRVVGQAFFNVIQVPCFEFAYKEECVEPYLYVWCKAYNTVAIAVPREPVLYEFGGELIDRAARPRGVPLSPLWSGAGSCSEEFEGSTQRQGIATNSCKALPSEERGSAQSPLSYPARPVERSSHTSAKFQNRKKLERQELPPVLPGHGLGRSDSTEGQSRGALGKAHCSQRSVQCNPKSLK
ncbi:PREDICTED: uncharacterized protein LOC104621810, partial [Phaethon lepturus]|uniref:uncharacterized protein LOC104621810 n=1 Tax=Phaethon lepturus TaxID=97097 RepID=UPI000530AA59